MLFGQKNSSETLESKYKVYLSNKIAKEMEQPEHRKKCWRYYRSGFFVTRRLTELLEDYFPLIFGFLKFSVNTFPRLKRVISSIVFRPVALMRVFSIIVKNKDVLFFSALRDFEKF